MNHWFEQWLQMHHLIRIALLYITLCCSYSKSSLLNNIGSTARQQLFKQYIKFPSVLLVSLSCVQKSTAEEPETFDSELYIDSNHRFSLMLLPGWTKFPGKTPTPTMLKYQTEESFLVSNNFQEGTSMSVTRTNAVRLLKDFDIEWWFSPLQRMSDLGSPELIAELLILQRQGDFEKKTTPSHILNSQIIDDTLTFEFDTPLAESVNRRTVAKAIFRPVVLGSKIAIPCIDVIWISALTSVMESDYRKKISFMQNSFQIIK